ncbi:inositol polyphosphate 5-phosphatase [Cladochytrium tenue]|nr:inositol polyphosphate 5-phosphatase [Cladochytrium tenue]
MPPRQSRPSAKTSSSPAPGSKLITSFFARASPVSNSIASSSIGVDSDVPEITTVAPTPSRTPASTSNPTSPRQTENHAINPLDEPPKETAVSDVGISPEPSSSSNSVDPAPEPPEEDPRTANPDAPKPEATANATKTYVVPPFDTPSVRESVPKSPLLSSKAPAPAPSPRTPTSAASLTSGNASIRNGRLVFREKRCDYAAHHKTVAELVEFHRFHESIAAPLQEFPPTFLPLLAKLVQDREIALTSVVKAVRHECIPVKSIENAIHQVASRINYGPPSIPSSEDLASLIANLTDEQRSELPVKKGPSANLKVAAQSAEQSSTVEEEGSSSIQHLPSVIESKAPDSPLHPQQLSPKAAKRKKDHDKTSIDKQRLGTFFQKVDKPVPSTQPTEVTEDHQDRFLPFRIRLGVTVAPASRFRSSSDPVDRTKWKLLQFQENFRPAYYGTWRKQSKVLSGRKPLAMDQSLLNYDVDSDAEWEEGEAEVKGEVEELESEDEEADPDDSDADMDDFLVKEDDEQAPPAAGSQTKTSKKKFVKLIPYMVGPWLATGSNQPPPVELLGYTAYADGQELPVKPFDCREAELDQSGSDKRNARPRLAFDASQTQTIVDTVVGSTLPMPKLLELLKTALPFASKLQLELKVKDLAVKERRRGDDKAKWYLRDNHQSSLSSPSESPMIPSKRKFETESEVHLGSESTPSEFDELSLKAFISTWNLNGRLPHDPTPVLPDFSSAEEEESLDFVVVGTQEFPRGASRSAWSSTLNDPWTARLSRRLKEAGREYSLVHSARMGSVHLAVFVRADMFASITDVVCGQLATGPYKIFGNKGALTISNFDFTFWFGDLNYRVNGTRGVIDRLITTDDRIEVLLSNDQLSHELRRGAAFAGFFEAPIDFLPTYKLDRTSNGGYDTSRKARIPSWTDRILVRAAADRGLRADVEAYGCRDGHGFSDHRPVAAVCRLLADAHSAPTPTSTA